MKVAPVKCIQQNNRVEQAPKSSFWRKQGRQEADHRFRTAVAPAKVTNPRRAIGPVSFTMGPVQRIEPDCTALAVAMGAVRRVPVPISWTLHVDWATATGTTAAMATSTRKQLA